MTRIYVDASDQKAVEAMLEFFENKTHLGKDVRFGCDPKDVKRFEINNPGEFFNESLQELCGPRWPIAELYLDPWNRRGPPAIKLTSCWGWAKEDSVITSRCYYEVENE